jgi:tellurite resistance protein
MIVRRFYLDPPMPPALRPSYGIQLAPPTVGAVAYLSITGGTPDWFVEALVGYGLFQALVLARLVPWIARQPFAASYWAFTFGVAAAATAALRLVERGLDSTPFVALAAALFVIANVIIVGIGVATVWLLVRGRLLPPPLTLAAAAH